MTTTASSGEPQPQATDAGSATTSAGPLPRLRDYELLEKLGQGGMGTVFKARHVRLDKLVAVKVLSSDRIDSPDAVVPFERETLAVGHLAHPNIIQALDAGEASGTHYLVLDRRRRRGHVGQTPQAEVCTECGQRYFHATTLDEIDELLVDGHPVRLLQLEFVARTDSDHLAARAAPQPWLRTLRAKRKGAQPITTVGQLFWLRPSFALLSG